MSRDGGDGLDLESIRREIARIAPHFAGEPVARLGEGMDSLAVVVGEGFVFRFAKHAESAIGVGREVALLPRLAPMLGVEVPRFEYVGEHSVTRRPFVGYRLIRGEPLHRTVFDGLADDVRDRVLGELSAFLKAVHGFPVPEAMDCGVVPHGDRAGYTDELRAARNVVFPHLDNAVRRVVEARLEAYLEDDANFAMPPVLLHGDLWPDHVLYSPVAGRLAGIIDFSDVCIGDPAYDLAFLALTLGPGFVDGLLRHEPDPDLARLVRKVNAIALFNAIDDVSIGLERDDRPLVASGLKDLIDLVEAGRSG